MKKLSVKEIQNIQLNILKEVADFCDKFNIKYFLGCGTLCGAVVRKSFFPWDDDIDILMPRKDYEKFLAIFQSKKLKLLTCNNKDYYYPYAKVVHSKTIAFECKNHIADYGVFIDVFPIDGAPNKLYLYLLKPLKYLMMSKWGCHLDKRNIFVKIIYKIVSIITIPIPNNYFARLLNKICRKYSLENCKKSGVIVHYRKNKEIVSSSIFDKRKKFIFEGSEFYGPKMYDEYLKALYDNYYEEDNHDYNKHFVAYWKKE